MINAPPYFENIRCKASARWDQLENDPELAAPWHQLFKQVQSPRHVLSELLQNADDAGATKAIVEIKDGNFIFQHNGQDFIEEHFASLCRFGYSNKRSLHTIGFRGVGFKSIFSISDKVNLYSPSLSVQFSNERFTEPVWLNCNETPSRYTKISVSIKDNHRLQELEKNLKEWMKSPASLLFFKSIRYLMIHENEFRWIQKAQGPIQGSYWMELANDPEERYLLVKSDSESFPQDALSEIRQERITALDKETSFPPCKIEIVLGFSGRLYVILPTGVKTDLPYACNAPFIQDPARLKIKDPEISPTNRWLLERVGKLAAEIMLKWLDQKNLAVEERCEAYRLLPHSKKDNNSIETSCENIVKNAFRRILMGSAYLLTEEGHLEKEGSCSSVPAILFEIWNTDDIKALFIEEETKILSKHIKSYHLKKLTKYDGFDEIARDSVLDSLKSKQIPKPKTWYQLLKLWAYVSEDLVGYHYYRHHKTIRIVPVQGREVLFSKNDVVRLGEKKLLQSTEDWHFLSNYLLVLNQNWPRYLADQRREASQNQNIERSRQVRDAYKVLDKLQLKDSSDISKVIQQVAEKFFKNTECDIEDCIRLAQISATLGASVSKEFQFVTIDGYRRPASHQIICDDNNHLDTFVSEQWYNEHVLHKDYNVMLSCSKAEWYQWVESKKSKINQFIPLTQKKYNMYRRKDVLNFLDERELKGEPNFHYKTDDFTIVDWDFEGEQWEFWQKYAQEDPGIWGDVFSKIIAQSKDYWEKAITAKVHHNGTKYSPIITEEELLPSWIIKFRSLPCLKDTRGYYREPAELLRRTPETESLLDVELFVRAEDDIESTRPLLIKLGVRDTPTGPDRLLERLKALSTVMNPPVYEVERWCNRIDQIVSRCSTTEFQQIKETFSTQKLVLTANLEWVGSTEVFLNEDEVDAPGSAVVHPAIKDLSIWRKMGIAERPTAELSLNWLTKIESNKKLSKDELRRVRALLARHPDRVWLECEHWLNLDSEWVPIEQLNYKLTMQTLIPWGNLFKPIKQKTADLQKLTAEMCNQYPFSQLPTLAERLENRLENEKIKIKESFLKPWLHALGKGLARIILDDNSESLEIREIGDRLSKTKWCVVNNLETTPYIADTPSGTPKAVDALWKNTILYVKNDSVGKLARTVSQELGRFFGRTDITDAIKLCFERDETFITDYLEKNFNLFPIEHTVPEKTLKQSSDDQTTTTQNTPKGSDQTDLQSTDLKEKTDKPPGDSYDSDLIDSEQDDQISSDEEENSHVQEDDFSDEENEPRKKKKKKTNLIERFAKNNGYVKVGEIPRYNHSDGGWIERVSGNSFPWEKYSAAGVLEQCYWIKELCIEREPLQIAADIWRLCIKYPEKYTIILAGLNGIPVEYSGKRICSLLDEGKITLFPASYRVVYEHEEGTKEDDTVIYQL